MNRTMMIPGRRSTTPGPPKSPDFPAKRGRSPRIVLVIAPSIYVLKYSLCQGGRDLIRRRSARSNTPEQIAEMVSKRAAKDSHLFRTSSEFPGDRLVFWGGNSVEDFLALFDRMGDGVLYLREETVGGDEKEFAEEFADRIDEVWLVEVAFLHDGIFHVFRNVASWAQELVADWETAIRPAGYEVMREGEGITDELETKALASRLEDEQDELVGGFLADVAESNEPLEPEGYLLRRRFKEFLVRERDFPDEIQFPSTWRLDPGISRALDSMTARIAAEIRDKERELLKGLVPQCAAWARKNGLKRLAQADVAVFVAEEHVTLSKESSRALWQRANFALKTGRVPG